MRYDLITIGDCTIDAFIKLKEASVQCDVRHEHCKLCVSFADKIPYESLTVVPAVGNSSNVAVSAARLGLQSAILTAVGKDMHGKQILDVYKKEGVGRDLVRINPKLDTNYHFVLTFGAERTILVKHHAYSYADPAKIDGAPWIYFSSMGEHTLPFHHKLAAFLKSHPKVKMGFNPGTFQLKLGKEKLRGIYRRTHILFVNREEATKILGSKSGDVKHLCNGLHRLGPKLVVVTDGPKGLYASDGVSQYFLPAYPDPKPPVQRTGAGDATGAGIMAGLIYGLPLRDALRWGPANAASVVQHIGAQKGLLTKKELMAWLKKAPKRYTAKEM